MRSVLGLALAGLALAFAPAARAQDAAGAFGGYPAGITTGSPYGFYPGGYRQTYSTYPMGSGYARTPGVSYYSSGFYGGTPGTTVYGPGVNFSSPNAAAYGYSTPYYSNPYGYSTYYGRGGGMGRGMFGRRGYR